MPNTGIEAVCFSSEHKWIESATHEDEEVCQHCGLVRPAVTFDNEPSLPVEFIPLAQLVDELRYTRQIAAEKRAIVKEIEKSIEDRLRAARFEQTEMDKQVSDLEQAIRERGVESYKRDSDKHPAMGVEIKLFDEATIEDPDKVRAFCFDNLPGALVVDEKKAKKYALDFDAVPGIKVERDVPRTQIATKL